VTLATAVVIDAHLHCTGDETTPDVLDALDDAGIDIGVLIAPFAQRPSAGRRGIDPARQ
jgi:hypothetical protein